MHPNFQQSGEGSLEKQPFAKSASPYLILRIETSYQEGILIN